MKQPVERKLDIVARFLRKEISIGKACEELGCTERTFLNLRKRFLSHGMEGLKDHRTGHNHKLTPRDKQALITLKGNDRWRSARNVRDAVKVDIHPETVRRLFLKEGLVKINVERVKPLRAFQAERPNDLWQTDIMGRIEFPRIGELYLIATLDDHSRFVPAGEWFGSQHKAHVFKVWYDSLVVAGIPEKMLQDRGSQYKANSKIGQADYQFYATKLGITLQWAKRAQTKGKIERFWKFVQRDFVPEVMNAESKQEVNEQFKKWLHWYNYEFKSPYFENQTHKSKWYPSTRRPDKKELNELLTVWERRTVSIYNTISLYGVWYRLPPGYARCRIWIKIVGTIMYFQSMDKLFFKCPLKFK